MHSWSACKKKKNDGHNLDEHFSRFEFVECTL
jgi:hypothetical protein